MPDERSAGVVLFRAHHGTRLFLVLQYEEGHWDFAKGHIEEGESERDAALRECREETGIGEMRFVPGFRECLGYTYIRYGSPRSKEVCFFLAETEAEEVRLSDEHQGYAWLTYEEAFSRLTYENARGILKSALGMLEGKG